MQGFLRRLLVARREMAESPTDGDDEENDEGSKLSDCIEFVCELVGFLG